MSKKRSTVEKVTAELNTHLDSAVSVITVRRRLYKPNIYGKATIPKLLVTDVNESQFITSGIVLEVTKFHFVISVLDCDVLAYVGNLIRSPPPAAKYAVLKDKIIKQYADSENVKLKALLQNLQLGDKTPSQLLMQMQELNNGCVDDGVLKTLFLHHLPVTMQQILSVCDDDLEKLSQIGDKINETTTNTAVVSALTTNTSLKSLETKIEELTKQIQRMSTHLLLSNNRNRTSKFRSRSRSVTIILGNVGIIHVMVIKLQNV
ncbi:uncharacterized protein LOC129972544 [Argiope bruennichi]|uniref:uncharacterized protein LOC129972544 n=1 Tax=Argiope bruennichi TaxID=94029 RepID=UPI002494B93E|nr:uncharacterized protein LOC129972544 [Argiope bruennichi]